jgi:outer membrane protein insertion porin family
LTYEVEEKSSDTFNASVGYSSFGLLGSIGVTFNNFSISEPWRGGDGQMLNFEWVFGRYDYRTFSLGFREPWFKDTPTSIGFNIVDTRYAFTYDLRQTGGSVSLGRRLRWPDDYFRVDYMFRFQLYNVSGTGGYYREGKWSQFSFTQVISRNSIDNPIFPTVGSNFSLSTEISGGPILPGIPITLKFMSVLNGLAEFSIGTNLYGIIHLIGVMWMVFIVVLSFRQLRCFQWVGLDLVI